MRTTTRTRFSHKQCVCTCVTIIILAGKYDSHRHSSAGYGVVVTETICQMLKVLSFRDPEGA